MLPPLLLSMDKTESNLRKLHAALVSGSYDLGVLDSRGMYPRLEALPFSRFLSLLPYLRFRNVNGAHIYFRPGGENRFTLLDDLTAEALLRMQQTGYRPCAVVETSPGNYQAWLKHETPLTRELGTLAARVLAERFAADPNAADWRRFGRLPGFTNRKPQHRNGAGLFPFVMLVGHDGQVFQRAGAFHAELLKLQEQRASPQRKSFAYVSSQKVAGLSEFRALSRYRGRPAAADMAFSIAAFARGWSIEQIGQALADNYLSRDKSVSRMSAYIHRTVSKAVQWVR